MNERIKELAEQAGWMMGEDVEGFNTRLEKFAELILTECVRKVRVRKRFAIQDDHTVQHAFDLLAYDIKAHFGVEE